MDLIDTVRFDNSFSFLYSSRPGTPAAELADNLPDSEKKERLNILQKRIGELARMYSEAMVGLHQNVLVEGTSRRSTSQMTGRTENNRVVNFDCSPAEIGQFLQIRITKTMPNSLQGVVAQHQQLSKVPSIV